jgi:hypothetical protein
MEPVTRPGGRGRKRLLIAAGLVILVFVLWFIGSSVVAAFTHVGSTYDPSIGAWFLDPSKENELASWSGTADLIGAVVALVLGVTYYFSGRGPQAASVPETQEERDARITGRRPSDST